MALGRYCWISMTLKSLVSQIPRLHPPALPFEREEIQELSSPMSSYLNVVAVFFMLMNPRKIKL